MIALLQAAGAVPTSAKELILDASTETQVVLVILVVLSLVSWAIMFGVDASCEGAARRDGVRARVRACAPRSTRRAGGEARAAERLAATVRARAAVPRRHAAAAAATATARGALLHGDAAASRVETLRLVLDAEALAERDRLGRFLPWLATIGSASPLIGLLGTVLGVISAFIGIATSGSGNIAAVAPGVAEALVATAAALSVAIPGVFGYNILANRLNRLDNAARGVRHDADRAARCARDGSSVRDGAGASACRSTPRSTSSA